MRALVLPWLLLVSLLSLSQTDNCHKAVPFFLSRNPQKLAKYLTKDLTTDEEKVCVIYDWITHHIKYDVKKWRRFDYNFVPAKKVLRKRKGVCEGYASLFNELCKNSGVRSVMVPGYVKTFDTDAIDNFYIDGHAWNAAYVNGRWKLFDATWDAGYIKFFKRTMLGYVIYTFTLGHADQYKFKPHFKRSPTRDYYSSFGTSFKTDHLPVNPIWQTNDTVLEVPQYKNDSAYYFNDYKKETEQEFKSTESEMKREEYFHQNEEERAIADGFISYSKNKRNQFGIGNSNLLLAKKKIEKINSSADTSLNRKSALNVLPLLQNAIVHYDSNAYCLGIQKNELAFANKLKNDMCRKHNTSLISSSKKVLSNANQGMTKSINTKTSFRKLNRANQKKLRRVWRDNSYDKTKFSKLGAEKDSVLIENALAVMDDSVKHQHENLRVVYSQLDSLYIKTLKSLTQYRFESQIARGAAHYAVEVRLHYFDDLDYPVRITKDSLMFYKFKNDSSVFVKDTFIVKNLLNETKRIKTEINIQYSLLRTKMKLHKALKKASRENTELLKRYDDEIQNLENEIYGCQTQAAGWMGKCLVLKQYCRKIKRSCRREIRPYKRELGLENALFRVRGQRNRSYVRSYVKLNAIYRSTAVKQKKKTEDYLKALAKKKK